MNAAPGGSSTTLDSPLGGSSTPLALPYHYMFQLLVFQFRVCSIDYFMDKMPLYELNDIIDNLGYLDRNLWEASRLNAWVTASVNSRNEMSFQDVAKFKWEDEIVEPHQTEISDDEIARLKKMACMIETR